MRVVAVMSSDHESPALAELAAHADVTRVAPGATASEPDTHRVDLHPLRGLARRIEQLAWRSAFGRNLVRITPLDRSRRLWRAVKHDAALRELVRAADVVVALDRDAVLTVWKLSREHTLGDQWDAVYGGAAALFALKNRR